MRRIIFLTLHLLVLMNANAQDWNSMASYDEAAIAPYKLPELLVTNSGTRVNNVTDWESTRRGEIVDILKDEMFGHLPDVKVNASYKILEESDKAIGNKAIRRQVEITWSTDHTERKALVLMYLPKGVKKAPVFLQMNFLGNGTLSTDEAVIESQYTRQPRNYQCRRWPLEKIIDAGYGVVTLHYYDIYYDDNDHFELTIYPLLGIKDKSQLKDNSANAIGAWAWGYSRVMDYLMEQDYIDHDRVICMGHSRLGKTSLWAGALDERFALVISNCSGCSGAAISRRRIGENLNIINNAFPHWFARNYHRYNDREEMLPFDEHELLSLSAPRPLYVASAVEDRWADPKGEFLAATELDELYSLYGYKGIGTRTMPDVNSPVGDRVAYHVRTGIHDVTTYDWENYIRFADKWLFGR